MTTQERTPAIRVCLISPDAEIVTGRGFDTAQPLDATVDDSSDIGGLSFQIRTTEWEFDDVPSFRLVTESPLIINAGDTQYVEFLREHI